MSRSSSRTAGASMKNRTIGCGASRSGWTMKVVVAPSLVAISMVCSIMRSDELRRLEVHLLQHGRGMIDAAGHGLRVARGQLVDRLGDVFDRRDPVPGLLGDQAVDGDPGRVHQAGRDHVD